MALVASGAIAFSDVNVELGYSSTATIALNDAAVRTLFGISTGAIAMSDGYGKAATLGYIENFFSVQTYQGNDAAASDDKKVKNVEAGIPLGTGSASFINSAGNENSIAMHLTGDTLTDSEGGTWTNVGSNAPYDNVTISTGTKKYGTGSLYFGGTSKLRVFLKRPFNGRHDKWTLEFWVNPASTDAGILIRSPNGSTNWYCRLSNNQFQFWTSGGTMFTPGFSATNTWSHIAVTNDGTNLRVFINGSLSGTTSLSFFTSPADTGYLDIGDGMTMYLDDVRVTLGTPLYTSAGFTAPTAALPVQTVVTGIGGMVWVKNRTSSTQGGNATDWALTDTVNGPTQWLSTNTTNALRSTSPWPAFSSFHGGGVTVGSYSGALAYSTNYRGDKYVAFLFGKSKKFFDIVTYSGNSVEGRAMPHNLGSVPGCIIVKTTTASGESWMVWHRSGTQLNNYAAALNTTAGYNNRGATFWGSMDGTPDMNASTFSLGTNTSVNQTGHSYVAYLFAHNAGGYGLTGTDNIITCGSYTGNSAAGGQLINLGYEAQWVMIKRSSADGGWWMIDNMRGWSVNGDYGGDYTIDANASTAEAYQVIGQPDARGFRPIQDNVNYSGSTYIYIAIRRGPMAVPTDATKVFVPLTSTYSANATLTTGFPVDLSIYKARDVTYDWSWDDRLRGTSNNASSGLASLRSNTTAAENDGYAYLGAANFDNTRGVSVSYNASTSYTGGSASYLLLRRAPKFFDIVCYKGTSSPYPATPQNVSHNLGAVPELIIIKVRNNSDNWFVYAAPVGVPNGMFLNSTIKPEDMSSRMNTAPTSTTFNVVSDATVNNSSYNYVAYLFATCPGVSKIGSYTGTAALQTVNCGFTSGARFVLIKRTDSTGDWWVFDSARGISSSTDPYILFNTTSGETTGTNYIDTDSTGFKVTAAAPAGMNASGGTYIFLAIA